MEEQLTTVNSFEAFLNTFGPSILASCLVILIGVMVVSPLITKFGHVPFRICRLPVHKINLHKECKNELAKVELLRRYMWGLGGMLVIAAFLAVAEFRSNIDLVNGAYGAASIGMFAGLKDFRNLQALTKISKIFKYDKLKSTRTGTEICVERIVGSSIVGSGPRPEMKGGVIPVADVINGDVEDLGPYGSGEKFYFKLDTKIPEFEAHMINQFHVRCAERLATLTGCKIVIDGKVVLPMILFEIKAELVDSHERDEFYRNVSFMFAEIMEGFPKGMITPFMPIEHIK